MPENQVTIKIGGDLSEIEGDAKKLGSALDGAARGGIAGFEAARQKVIELTKTMGELRTALLQTSDPAVQGRLNAALGQTQKQLQAAKTEMRGMALESRQTNEQVQLLAAQFGVHLPQGMERLIARMPAVQAVLGAAFNVTIIGAFAGALIGLGIEGWHAIEKLRGKTEELAGWLKKAADENMRLLLGFATPTRGAEVIAEFTKRSAEVADRVVALKKQLQDLDPAAAVAAMIISSRLTKAEHEALVISDQLNEALRNQTKLLQDDHKKAVEEGVKNLKALTETLREQLLYWAAMKDAPVEALMETARAAEKSREELDKFMEAASHKFTMEQNRENDEVIKEMEQRGARFSKTFLDEVGTARKASQDIAEAQRAAAEKLAGSIEQFIDRVFVQARSIADVFHQFLMQLLSSFVKWVSQMISQIPWVLEHFTGQGTGAGVNLFGSLWSTLFGGRSTATGGVTSAAATGATGIEAAWTSSSLPQGAIGVWQGGSALTTAGGASGAMGGGGIGSLGGLSAGGPFGLIAMGAMATAMTLKKAWTAGSPLIGAIGGIMTGDLSLGLGLGVLLGALGRGKLKKKATALEQGFEASADQIYDQFKTFQVDYDSALSGLQGLITAGQQALTSAGLGKWGKLGAANLAKSVQQEIEAVKSLEKQREANTAIIGGMTVPEFATGGPVGFGAGILALLHPGEFVMQKSAVDSLGGSFLAALNRAPSFAEGGAVGMRAARPVTVNFYTTAFDGPSVDAWWRRNQGRVLKVVRRGVGDGAM